MAKKDISTLFSQAVNKFRADQEKHETPRNSGLSPLERDFEMVKDEVRKLRSHIESHPRVNHFWVFTDKIIVDFHPGTSRSAVQIIIQLYPPEKNRLKQGMFGYLPDGYEVPLENVDEAVEFFATQCGKLLA